MGRCCSSLGFTKSFSVNFQANLAGVIKEHRVLLPLRGQGKLSFFFEATHDSKVLAVHLEEAALMLQPFSVKLPGRSETLEVPQTFIGSHIFALSKCNGLLHLNTKQFNLNLHLTLTHETFPQLSAVGVSAPVAIRVVEKGHMDLTTGAFDTHATSFDVSGGLMRSLVVHPGAKDEKSALQFRNSFSSPSDAAMEAKAIVGATNEGQCFERGFTDVLVCPGHAVTLCWRSAGNSPNVSTPTDPPKAIPSQGSMPVKPTASTKFHFDVQSASKDKNGNPIHVSADVDVQVVTNGMVWPMTFAANPYTGLWEQNISKFQVDPSIVVDKMIVVPCQNQQVLLDSFTLVWKNPDQSPHNASFNINAHNDEPIGVPLVGDWTLSIGPNIRDVSGNVCVNAFIRCTG